MASYSMDLIKSGLESIPGYISTRDSLSSALGYTADTSCWQQIYTHPIAAATGAIVGGGIGYSYLGLFGFGLAAIVTPNLVTSPRVMSAANTALHHATSLYSSHYVQDMGPALNSLAKDFVWSVPSNQDIVVGHLNRLLGDMKEVEKTAFLKYLNGLTPDKKEDAHTLLAALVVLNVPPSERITFCQLLEKVPSSERSLFVLAAINLGIPASQRLQCYDILRGVEADKREEFVQQANSLLDPSMPEQAQTEVIRILSEIPAAERDAYIGALNTISLKSDPARVQIMQGLQAITVDRAVVATNYNLIIQKLSLTKKEKADLSIDDKLVILKTASHLTGKQMIDTMWKKADKHLSIESLTPQNKIALFHNLAKIPEAIRVDVIKILADKWIMEDRNKILKNMAKLTPEDAQLLQAHNIVGLFADLKSEDQENFLRLMNMPGAKQQELVEILRHKDWITSVKISMPRFSLSSPNAPRRSSFAKKLDAFERSIAAPPSQLPAPAVIPPSNVNSSNSVLGGNPFNELINPSSSVSTKNPFDELLPSAPVSSSVWSWDPVSSPALPPSPSSSSSSSSSSMPARVASPLSSAPPQHLDLPAFVAPVSISNNGLSDPKIDDEELVSFDPPDFSYHPKEEESDPDVKEESSLLVDSNLEYTVDPLPKEERRHGLSASSSSSPVPPSSGVPSESFTESYDASPKENSDRHIFSRLFDSLRKKTKSKE